MVQLNAPHMSGIDKAIRKYLSAKAKDVAVDVQGVQVHPPTANLKQNPTPVDSMGAMALLPICDSSFTCEDYNTYRAHPWSPFPLRRGHPGPGPHTHIHV